MDAIQVAAEILRLRDRLDAGELELRIAFGLSPGASPLNPDVAHGLRRHLHATAPSASILSQFYDTPCGIEASVFFYVNSTTGRRLTKRQEATATTSLGRLLGLVRAVGDRIPLRKFRGRYRMIVVAAAAVETKCSFTGCSGSAAVQNLIDFALSAATETITSRAKCGSLEGIPFELLLPPIDLLSLSLFAVSAIDQPETLTAEPPAIELEPPADLRPMQKQAWVYVVHTVGRRMTQRQIAIGLGLDPSLSTLKAALSDMSRDGVLPNRSDTSPAGYGHPIWPTIMAKNEKR